MKRRSYARLSNFCSEPHQPSRPAPDSNVDRNVGTGANSRSEWVIFGSWIPYIFTAGSEQNVNNYCLYVKERLHRGDGSLLHQLAVDSVYQRADALKRRCAGIIADSDFTAHDLA
jgi:hypothetical protein